MYIFAFLICEENRPSSGVFVTVGPSLVFFLATVDLRFDFFFQSYNRFVMVFI